MGGGKRGRKEGEGGGGREGERGEVKEGEEREEGEGVHISTADGGKAVQECHSPGYVEWLR